MSKSFCTHAGELGEDTMKSAWEVGLKNTFGRWFMICRETVNKNVQNLELAKVISV